MNDAPLTPAQVKAARELLGWTRIRLAFRVGVTDATIEAFESGESWSRPLNPRWRPLNLDRLRERLESAGVIFVEENGEGPGVRLMRKAAK
jgi:DNA-binding XRE family transcriptional regulator